MTTQDFAANKFCDYEQSSIGVTSFENLFIKSAVCVRVHGNGERATDVC